MKGSSFISNTPDVGINKRNKDATKIAHKSFDRETKHSTDVKPC